MSGGIIMENIVTMSLEDYDELKETINNQKKYIETNVSLLRTLV